MEDLIVDSEIDNCMIEDMIFGEGVYGNKDLVDHFVFSTVTICEYVLVWDNYNFNLQRNEKNSIGHLDLLLVTESRR